MEGKVAVLGDADFVMPFSALGLDTFPVNRKPQSLGENARKILEENYALVVVAENTAPAAEEFFASVQNAATPCIVVVPFTTEPTGFATKELGEALKIATGINILQGTQTQ